MHPTSAGFYPFLLESPARCAFLSYLCLYICLGSPARSRPSRSAVALTLLRRLVGVLERGVEVLEAMEGRYQKMDERERDYKRMDEQEWNEKADEEEEDEEEDEDEEEKVEVVTRAEMEMGMEIAEKGTEKGMDEEMGEAVEGMEVEE